VKRGIGFPLNRLRPRRWPRGRSIRRGPRIGETIVCFGHVDSTQRTAKELALGGAPHGTIVVAEEQGAGRGRRGRSWWSPAGGGVWSTVLLRGPIAGASAHLLTLAGAVSVCEAARELGIGRAEVKWPNDLIARGRKFGGLLGECLGGGPEGAALALLGIGVNLALPPAAAVPADEAVTVLRDRVPPATAAGEVPRVEPASTARAAREEPFHAQIAGIATSLCAEGLDEAYGREEVLARIGSRLEAWWGALVSGSAEPRIARLRELSPSAEGRRALVEEADGAATVRGTTRGLGADGSLAFEEEGSGRLRRFRFGGTLRLLAPAGEGMP
jgi:biotin-(acetyl-CoA carboxylase) ligase